MCALVTLVYVGVSLAQTHLAHDYTDGFQLFKYETCLDVDDPYLCCSIIVIDKISTSICDSLLGEGDDSLVN